MEKKIAIKVIELAFSSFGRQGISDE